MQRFSKRFSIVSTKLPLLLVAVLAIGTAGIQPMLTYALSGSDFHAGHIIDDVVFTNSSSMSVQDIQNFLNAKVPICDTNGAQSKSYYYDSSTGNIGTGAWVTTSRATYGQRYDPWYQRQSVSYYYNSSTGEVDNPSSGTKISTTRAIYEQRYSAWHHVTFSTADKAAAPYVCLKNYVENPTTHANNIHNPTASISGGQSAAQIIYTAATTYNINPQVLLVTLQKEQGIVTDDWPWTNEYRIAMGYGCPDTAPCDSNFFGFANQVNKAAWQFRRYLDMPDNYNYVVGDNFIAYNPTGSCGGSNVSIQNQATAALYDYTPYQPNPAALSGLNETSPGGGDSCSAYGNRNFWWYFNNWFGSPIAPTYWWSPVSQSVFTDSSKTTVGSSTMVTGQRRYLQVKVKNTGTATWTRGSIKLATSSPGDRTSSFYDTSWLDKNRAAGLVEASVAPGDTGTFEFWITASQAGNFKEYFNLVNEGVTWFNDNGLYFPLSVEAQHYTWQPTSQELYYDSARTIPTDWSVDTITGQRLYARLTVKNTGNTTWSNSGPNPVRLGTTGPGDRSSSFCDSSWGGCNRPATLKEASVAPGGTGTFEFTLSPKQAGAFKESYSLLSEGKAWMNDVGLYYPIDVDSPKYTYKITDQSAYSDPSLTTKLPYNLTMSTGQSAYFVIKAKNTSNFAWGSSVLVATSSPGDRASSFYDGSWLSTNRPASANESIVYPGQTATFVFKVTASKTGTYKEYFGLVDEGHAWFSDLGMYYQVTVH